MAHITFYEKPGCGGNARQKAMLLAAQHTLEVKNLLSSRWKKEELLLFLSPLAVPDWFNRAAPQVKSGEVVPESLTAEAALALLLAQPLLIRRPLMAVGEQRMVGFDLAAVHAWVGLAPNAPASGSLEGCAAAAGHCPAPF
jgi:nitrogenase-associated protein